MNTVFIILNLIVFVGLIIGLVLLEHRKMKFSYRVMIGLIIGLLFGALLQLLYGMDNEILSKTVSWISLVGSGFVRLLQMIVMPLIFISILAAFSKMDVTEKFFKSGVKIISILLGTTAISAIVGIATALLFKLDASSINLGDDENQRAVSIEESANEMGDLSLPEQLVSLLPSNAFEDFAGMRPTSTIAVVLFAVFMGISLIKLLQKNSEHGEMVRSIILAVNDWIMELVKFILRLTPYGILAIMANTVATSNFAALKDLGLFVIASYVALIGMYLIHLLLIALIGLSPVRYFKKTAETLIFAFTSRSSAGSLPLNIQTQQNRLGIPSSVANFAGSFGLSIGQNGCAGVYPSMLAIMVAPVAGVEVNLQFILTLIAVTVISSLGIAGVGGGATFAAIVVLSTMNLPVALAAVLISVEPLIDMGRTALNVSGSMLSGTITSKTDGTLNKEIYNSNQMDELTTPSI